MANTQYYTASAGSAAIHLFDENGFIASHALQYITTIGRTTAAQCDIVVDYPFVSRKHGEILFADGQYRYKDLESTNGTYINGKYYGRAASCTALLTDGDIISFKVKSPDAAAEKKVVGIFACTDKDIEWSEIPLLDDMAELCVGRGQQSGLVIEDAYISERHASFFKASGGWAIIDHKSKNGVFLNGIRITAPRYLKNNDVIRIADTYFVFYEDRLYCSAAMKRQPQHEGDRSSALQPLTQAKEERKEKRNGARNDTATTDQLCIHIVERSVVQRFKKMLLLTDIDLAVHNGEMVLILGGSGAGKTTFINAVMGYEKAEGQIIYRDTDIYEEYEQMKYEIGFVPQQDLLRGSDTVYHTLSNAAQMKLPKRYSFEDREKQIGNMLEEFGLSRERDTLVSKLSGGQRKRLSIAVEFIAGPSLFFLDEPDSGLDDIMGRGLMENLRRIADKGKIVMVITHSPERAAGLFDKVIVLAKSSTDNAGHLAFFGGIQEAFDFFGVSSFREIVKKINRPDENGDGLADFYIEKYAAREETGNNA